MVLKNFEEVIVVLVDFERLVRFLCIGMNDGAQLDDGNAYLT